MFNQRKFIPLPSAFADRTVWCVGGRFLPAALDMAHMTDMTVPFPIYRGVTR